MSTSEDRGGREMGGRDDPVTKIIDTKRAAVEEIGVARGVKLGSVKPRVREIETGAPQKGLLLWAGGVLDAALVTRIDRTKSSGERKKAKELQSWNSYSLRAWLTCGDVVARAWCRVVGIPFKRTWGKMFIPAKDQLRILQMLKPYSMREDLAVIINFRLLRDRGKNEFKAAKEITEAIKGEERNGGHNDGS